MNYLVTGCMGSMGRRVVERLLAAGHEVTGTDLPRTAPPGEDCEGYNACWGDFCDSSFVRGLFSGACFDGVIHLAAVICGGKGLTERPADALGDNVLMTANLLKHGVGRIRRFAYVSSSMVYENCDPPHHELNLTWQTSPYSAYGLSKYVGERLVEAHCSQHGQNYVIWRPFNVVDPQERARGRGVSHVIPDLIEEIVVRKSDPVRVLGDGQQVRCFTHVDDAAGAVADLSMLDGARNERFNLGCPRFPVTVLELADLISGHAKTMDLLPLEHAPRFRHLPFDGDVRRRIPDTEHVEHVFDWWAENSDIDSIVLDCLRARFPEA